MKIRLVSWPRVAAALVTLAVLAALQPAIPGAGGRAAAQSARGGGFLGVMLQDLDKDLRDSYDFRGTGVLITEVSGGSPAERAGLQRGDIVTRYRGRGIGSSSDLTDQVRGGRVGDRASITVWREGRERTISVTLGSLSDARAPGAPVPPQMGDRGERGEDDEDTPDMPDTPTPPGAARERSFRFHSDSDGDEGLARGLAMLGARPRLGIELQDLDSDLGGYFNRPDGKGVLVLHVVDGSAAKSAGIRAGDVIVELEGRSVNDAEDLRRELGSRDAGPVRVTVIRKGARQVLTARLSERSDPMAMGQRMQMFRLNGRDMTAPRGMMGGDGSDQQRELRRQMDDLRKQMDDLRRDMQRLHRDQGRNDRN